MPKEQVASILRAMQILECFTVPDREWTLKALTEQLSLPSTTVYRQVTTLAEQQYLTQDPVRKTYRPGPRLVRLASAIVGQNDLRRIARPELERLSAVVRETINLSTLMEHDIFYLDKVETHRSIACNTRVGGSAPAYATAAGKVLLASAEEAARSRYLIWMARNARAVTPRTVTDPIALRRQLSEAVQTGYALDEGEIEDGLSCIAAPILDMNGRAVAAVSISGPDFRMREEKELMIQELLRATTAISRCLGYSQQSA